MSAAAVHVRGVVKRLGARRALAGVDLFACGGVTAVLGANGAGKTTLLRCVATVLAADEGEVRVDGLDVARPGERRRVRERLGYLPQRAQFNARARVFDAVDYLAVLRGFDDERRRRVAVFDALDVVGLRARARDRVGQLSGGMQQRLGVAQAIVGSPSLVVLDEPSAGLDPEHRLDVRGVFASLGARSTVLVSTHLTDDVASVARVVVVLADGRVRWTGTPTGLAATAAGSVWHAPDPGVGRAVPGARRQWRLADGTVRCLGLPPAGARLLEPTMEEGYLSVVDPVP